jgi:hypothetical protein
MVAFLTEIPGATAAAFKKDHKFDKAEKEALARVHSILSAWEADGSAIMFNFDMMASVGAVTGSLLALLDTVMADASGNGTAISWRNWFLNKESQSLAFREVGGSDIVPRQMAQIFLKVLAEMKPAWAPASTRVAAIAKEGADLMNTLGQDAKRRCCTIQEHFSP